MPRPWIGLTPPAGSFWPDIFRRSRAGTSITLASGSGEAGGTTERSQVHVYRSGRGPCVPVDRKLFQAAWLPGAWRNSDRDSEPSIRRQMRSCPRPSQWCSTELSLPGSFIIRSHPWTANGPRRRFHRMIQSCVMSPIAIAMCWSSRADRNIRRKHSSSSRSSIGRTRWRNWQISIARFRRWPKSARGF